MNSARVLVAGIGNIFLGDDAFGVEVVQRLARRACPAEVRVVDFGIRGLDLVYALVDGYESVVLIDTVDRGQPPGTLLVIEPEIDYAAAPVPGEMLLDGHSMDPAKVLRLAHSLGAPVQRIVLVGCQPSPLDSDDLQSDDMRMGLSPPVQAAVGEAVEMVSSLVAKLLAGDRPSGDEVEAVSLSASQEI